MAEPIFKPPYRCFQKHAEDVTREVESALKEQLLAFGEMRMGGWKVLVHCSKDHANVFEGEFK